jgi:hypothetical protein
MAYRDAVRCGRTGPNDLGEAVRGSSELTDQKSERGAAKRNNYHLTERAPARSITQLYGRFGPGERAIPLGMFVFRGPL